MSKATGDSRYQEVADKALLQDSNVPPSSYMVDFRMGVIWGDHIPITRLAWGYYKCSWGNRIHDGGMTSCPYPHHTPLITNPIPLIL